MSVATVRLWDPLVRLFHLSVAGVFVANYFFNEAGDDWHTWLGYYAAGWLAVRIVWGFTGPQSARWSDFWPTVTRLRAHVSALVQGRDIHRLGHSPLGALVMVLMMTCIGSLALTGFMMQEVDALWGAEWLEQLHELIANTLAGLVCVHITAAVVESLRLRDNLPLSMITGRRRPLPEDH